MPRIERAFVERAATEAMQETPPGFREFQARNLPAEISFRNPETILAFLSLLGLALLLGRASWRQRPALWAGLLVLNFLPVLLFAGRFVPRQPMARWHELLAGGPEHQKIMEKMRDTPLRLFEVAPGWNDQLFPKCLSHLYRVRVVHGDSSLWPRNLFRLPAEEKERWKPQLADLIYESAARGQAAGRLLTNATPGLARFQWVQPSARPFAVESLGLNATRLTFEPGAAGTLLWTDTYNPGWRAILDGQRTSLTRVEPCFSQFEIPAAARTLVLQYEPRFFRAGKWLALAGLLGLAGFGYTLAARKRLRRP